jgi:hypothetical protein
MAIEYKPLNQNRMKTAVEWLYEHILLTPLDIRSINKCLEQAKEMEKEQIVDAFSEGTRMIDVNDEMSAMLNGFIYYGETYEQD